MTVALLFASGTSTEPHRTIFSYPMLIINMFYVYVTSVMDITRLLCMHIFLLLSLY